MCHKNVSVIYCSLVNSEMLFESRWIRASNLVLDRLAEWLRFVYPPRAASQSFACR